MFLFGKSDFQTYIFGIFYFRSSCWAHLITSKYCPYIYYNMRPYNICQVLFYKNETRFLRSQKSVYSLLQISNIAYTVHIPFVPLLLYLPPLENPYHYTLTYGGILIHYLESILFLHILFEIPSFFHCFH